MAEGEGSRHAPIALDDDDNGVYASAPSVRPRDRRTYDQDGFEEIFEQPRNVAAAGRERGDRNSGGPSGSRRESHATGRGARQTVFEKSTAYVNLCSDDHEPAAAPATPQHTGVPVLHTAKASTPSPETISNNRSLQRPGVIEPSETLIPPVNVATPPVRSQYRSPYSPRLPDETTPETLPLMGPSEPSTGRMPTGIAALLGDYNSSPPAPSPGPSALDQFDEPAPPDLQTLEQPTAPAERKSRSRSRVRSSPVLDFEASSARRDGQNSPIRGFEDHNGEQATSGRVNTSFPASAATQVEAAILMYAKARRSHGPTVVKVPPKQKAIKSVKRQPPAKDLNAESGGRRPDPSRGHIRSPGRQAPSAYADATANVEPRLTERPKASGVNIPELPRTVSEVAQDAHGRLPLRASNANLSPPFATASVQISIEASREANQDVQPLSPTLLAQGDNRVTMAMGIPADEPVAARSAIDACLTRHLEIRHETHAYLMWSKMMRQRTCQEQELRRRARPFKGKLPPPSTVPGRYVQYVSPFANMPAIQAPWDRSIKRLPDITQEVYVKAKPKDTVIKSVLVASPTKYKSDAVKIPPFKEYVSLRNNILADNESKLLATPYFQDEDYTGRQALMKALPTMYEMTHDEAGPLDFRKEQCRFYKNSIEAFLAEIGVDWNDVLYWLLASDEMIKQINDATPASKLFEAVLLERSEYHIEEFQRDEQLKKAELFNRNSRKWRVFLPQLNQPSAVVLKLAAIACSAILQECEFSVWYLAQQSNVVQDHISRKTQAGQATTRATYREMMCRVCHQHNCLLHGELREVPEDSWKTDSEDQGEVSDDEVDHPKDPSSNTHVRRESQQDHSLPEDQLEDGPLPAHFHDDSDIEKVINYKLPANPEAFKIHGESELISTKGVKPPAGKFNSNWWLQQDLTHHWEKRKPFFPCNHEGSCEHAQCRCFREGINCEKTCKCSSLCNRRYPGCTCPATPGKRICGTASCLCVKFNRECDADLCVSCGATDVLDPVNRYDDDVVQANCCNVAIQRGVPRKTLLGHSEVHGFGLYMGEDIKCGEYIGEYTGEAISVSEGDRRVTIYDYQKTMYLFRLNSKQEVDATYMGNKLRFVNNADEKYTNCCPKNLLCNTVFRIALFATTDIKAGTELYFNYNYPKEKTAQFKQPNGKVVAVKQSKQKAKKKELLSSSQAVSPRVLAATAKARAAKAAKRALEGSSQTSARRSGPLQARKAATSEPGRKKAPTARARKLVLDRHNSDASDSGMDAETTDSEIPLLGESQDTQTTESTRFVPDSDEEDDDFILGNTLEEEEEDFDIPISDAEEDTIVEGTPKRRGPGRPRKMVSGMSGMTPVVAVRKKKGGARPGAGRKRKRPVITNSDDD